VAVIVATLALGAALHSVPRLHGKPRIASQASVPAVIQTPQATDVTPPTLPNSEAGEEPTVPLTATAVPAAPPAATTVATSPPNLSGSWHGEYVDSTGKQLLRVVNLSIDRVREDGGIEGRLLYESASGDGECRLHPGGSIYSARERRLQLRPEGCSPHYPKELGVPLDFAGVNPWASALGNGRVEAPTGEAIRVRLKRVSGV
jgi:hypothetical protein